MDAGAAILDLTLDLSLLTAILAFGGLLTTLLVGRWDSLRIMALAFPIGSGVLTWLLFLVSWAGLRLDGRTVSVAYLLACAACVLLLVASSRQRGGTAVGPRPIATQTRSWGWILPALLGVIAMLWLASNLILSVSRAYSLWDAIAIWSVKGYGISREGSIFAARTWGGHGLSYPLHIPLLISLFDLAGGDVLPGSKMIFPLYLASLLVGFYGFGRRIGLRKEVAILSGLCVASIPVLFTESTSGYANAPLTVYLVLGALAILEAALGSSEGNLLIGGLLLGLASWTRVEGVLYSVAILLAGLVGLGVVGRRGLRWVSGIGLFALVVAPWLVFYRAYGATSSQAVGSLTAALRAILEGELRLGSLRIVLAETARSLADVESWGWIWIMSAILAVLGIRRANSTGRAVFLTAFIMSAGAALVTVTLFYVGSFGVSDLRGWLERGLRREILPAPALLYGGALALLKPPSPSGREQGSNVEDSPIGRVKASP